VFGAGRDYRTGGWARPLEHGLPTNQATPDTNFVAGTAIRVT